MPCAFSGYRSDLPTHNTAPILHPQLQALRRSGSTESNQVRHNQKESPWMSGGRLSLTTGLMVTVESACCRWQPRALVRPLSKIQSNPCMATPPQLCNLTHGKVLGLDTPHHCFHALFCHFSCEHKVRFKVFALFFGVFVYKLLRCKRWVYFLLSSDYLRLSCNFSQVCLYFSFCVLMLKTWPHLHKMLVRIPFSWFFISTPVFHYQGLQSIWGVMRSYEYAAGK